MKKINILLLLFILTIITTKNFAQGPQTCKTYQSTAATLVINGVTYNSNNAANPIIINVPNGQTTISGICGYQSLTCQNPNQNPNQNPATLTPRTDVRVYEGAQFISSTEGVWNTTTTAVNINLGLSSIQVSGNCKNGITDGNSGGTCYLGTFKVKVVEAPPTPPTPPSGTGNTSTGGTRFNSGGYRGLLGPRLYLGAGFFRPKIQLGELGNLVSKSAISYDLGVEIPISNFISIVPNVSYSSFTLNNGLDIFNNKYKVEGPTAGNSTKSFSGASKNATVISAGITAKMTLQSKCIACHWPIKYLFVSPSIEIGVKKITFPPNALQIVDDNLKINADTKLPYLQLAEGSTTGLYVLPSLDLGCWLTNRIALVGIVGYSIGPKLKLSAKTWNAIDANKDGLFTSQEMLSGSQVITPINNSMNMLKVGIGLKVALRKNNYIGHVTLLK
jgi:hypothetical protein